MDDPREILRAAGVECAEVGVYRLAADRWEVDSHDNGDESVNAADAAILALARLAAKYKWQRDECADDLGRKLAVDYKYEAAKPFAAQDVIVDLNRRWDERGTK